MTPSDAVFKVGDVNTELIVQFLDGTGAVIDISTASVKQIVLKRPAVGGTHAVLVKTASLYTDGTDGKAVYRTVTGDFSVAGFYEIEGYAEIGANEFTTAGEQFPVLNTNQTEDT